MPSATFLRAKLLPPRPAPSLLARPRLVERLLANLSNPVTLVTANAGSGKTTLVAEFVRSHTDAFVWYQLDAADADPSVFLGYLASGIQQVFPGVGDATLAYIEQATRELTFVAERAVDVLLNELLDGAERQLVVVLDDYHHLGPDAEVHATVDRLLAYLPDAVHAIVISRDTPPLSFARMRARAALEVIDRDDLLFTVDETRELFRTVFGLDLTVEQLSEYGERTRGWITALQLVRQVAQRRTAADGHALDDVLQQSEHDIFEYFAEEVFADESVKAQQLLLHAALLERIELDVCAALFPDLDCSRQLPSLVRRNVFLSMAGDAAGVEYRLHPLFRAFLVRRARLDLGAKQFAAEHARFAAYFSSCDRWEQAIAHMRDAGDFAGIAGALALVGGRWISAGAIGLLITWADTLSREVIESEPRALFYRAEAARLQGDLDLAERMLHRAAQRFGVSDDREAQAEAFHSLATISRRKGDFILAFAHLDLATALSEPIARVRIKCANTRGLILKEQGEWAAAEAEFRGALELAESHGDDHYIRFISHNLGLLPMMRGGFSEALRWLRRLVSEEDATPLPQQATANLNVARCLLYRGDDEASEVHLERALELCRVFNLSALQGEVFETYGNLFRDRGDRERAVEFYDRAERAYDAADIDPTRRELFEERAVLSLETGDIVGALATLERLAWARKGNGDELGRRTVGLVYGRALAISGILDAARAELVPALALFKEQSLHYYEAQASLALAVCERGAGAESEMLAYIARAVDLAIRFDNEHWLRREVARDPALFDSPEARRLLPADLRETVEEAAARPEPERATSPPIVAAPTADLSVNMLGVVDVFRDPARPFASDAWATRRARDILCFVAARPFMRAPKDLLIDTFWGEDDFDVVQKNFHPTVSYIRKALNSQQPFKVNFLVYRDGEYMLTPELTYRIDVHEFDRLLAEAEAARRADLRDEYHGGLERAVALYRGEFMAGSYEPWVESPRAYYRQKYLRAVETLALAAEERGDWIQSLDLADRILREDSFREDVHVVAMRAHAALGNRGAVREQFETLRRALDEELGVEPAPETRKSYKELMG